MAIFSRRVLQRFLDEIGRDSSALDLGHLVHRLNRGDQQSLATEWELVVLHALSRSGRVWHEADLGGASRVDVVYEGVGSPGFRFAADVACPSDRGLDEENPVDRVFAFIGARAAKLGLPGGFDCRIPGDVVGPYGNGRMQLALPPGKRIDEALQRALAPWLKRLATERPGSAELAIEEDGFRLSVRYDAAELFSGGSHPSYDVAYSRTRNPVHNALKQKAAQLRASGFDGPMGVFLCDGDCALLRAGMPSPDAFGLRDVVGDFLRQNTAIGFVVAVAVVEEGYWPRARGPRLHVEAFRNPKARNVLGEEELLAALEGFRGLPRPEQTPANALSWMEHRPRQGRPWTELTTDGGPWSVSKISVSARAVLEVLAGRKTSSEFAEEFGLGATPEQPDAQPFAAALAGGRSIRDARIRRLPDTDDDVIEFEFGDPDPSVSRLLAPDGKG